MQVSGAGGLNPSPRRFEMCTFPLLFENSGAIVSRYMTVIGV
jgi:hypothetical protein